MKEIGIYKLMRDGIDQGTFTSFKKAIRYLNDWNESYFNQDEYDPNYTPNWELIPLEREEEEDE